MSDSRAAARAAESALAILQAERPLGTPPGLTIHVPPEPSGAAIRGQVWVRVSATVADQSAELVGLVPDGPALRHARDRDSASPTTREGP